MLKQLCACSIAAVALELTFHDLFAGTSVITVTATDADDQTYGNSAKLVYSILQGQPYFSVDSENGKTNPAGSLGCSFLCYASLQYLFIQIPCTQCVCEN